LEFRKRTKGRSWKRGKIRNKRWKEQEEEIKTEETHSKTQQTWSMIATLLATQSVVFRINTWGVKHLLTTTRTKPPSLEVTPQSCIQKTLASNLCQEINFHDNFRRFTQPIQPNYGRVPQFLSISSSILPTDAI
jgi:hypothetical protein